MTLTTTPEQQERVALKIRRIQESLQSEPVDAWLFYYFKNNDPISLSVLELGGDSLYSRRWFYLVPAKGEPIKLVHRIEMEALDSLPGQKVVYLGWAELEQKLKQILKGFKTIAMQYSPKSAVPYVARVDAGTIELIESLDKEVVTSANLVQHFEARWTQAQLESHKYATDTLRKIVDEAFAKVRESLSADVDINEYDIQQFIMSRFDHYNLYTYSPPIVAINEHSGSPHYQPTRTTHSPIRKNDFLLIDLWAKRKDMPDAIYGDITWTGFTGEHVPTKHKEIFDIVSGARDAAVTFIKDSLEANKKLFGWQVDDVTRNYIKERGYGEYFVHRTGHSIGTEVHGNGANVDNLETKDTRELIPYTGFSIEPGIYLDEFGVRSEIDVYIGGDNQVVIAGQPIQTEVVAIMRAP